MVEICINIAFAIFIISCFAKNLNSEHFNVIDQILQYLARSVDKKVKFREKKKLKLINYFNSN